MPQTWLEMSKTYSFDKFKKHDSTALTIFNHDPVTKVINKFSEPISKNNQCVDKLDASIEIKTWYGITYGTTF